jgi:hypothetical protein
VGCFIFLNFYVLIPYGKRRIGVTDERTVVMHGFAKDEIVKIMRLIKGELENPKEIVFCMSTPTNLEWKLKDIVKDTRNEHEELKANPPQVP